MSKIVKLKFYLLPPSLDIRVKEKYKHIKLLPDIYKLGNECITSFMCSRRSDKLINIRLNPIKRHGDVQRHHPHALPNQHVKRTPI